ncbi:hypothetical protein CC85DRAFT_288560 [Cutaneotrichosporon oleaginosum]|uniref:MARVEL domain-containing protein n=1 Tax=Cutaneotrichosporon oleaginosum TaxID=879819 RepID=A0A0J0XEE0_9TREE|nr:uncharacterized protein CC85DRAFT_288560 [Cutaneotrichosporon oleaginosum]KLT39436.1 hypothetical protein CC85DRAFT_288560 [Cutaneotrichosporon oleaginosum]TXT08442.1 hypothetical protein COLE_05366 [Cutaneotrichosporon oleaginosum]
MASATRVQLWTYGVLLLIATVLATLLGTAVAEAASAPGTPTLSLLVAAFAFSLATFAYLLMFLVVRQLQPNAPLLWLASDCAVLTVLTVFGYGCAVAFTARGVLGLGSCSEPSTQHSHCTYVPKNTAYHSLVVAAGALLWICAVLLSAILTYLVINKAVNHPGREAWTRSLQSLTEHPSRTRAVMLSSRSPTILEDPFTEPEAVRPILHVDLLEDGHSRSSPPRSRYAASLPRFHARTGSPSPSRSRAEPPARSQTSQSTAGHSPSHTVPRSAISPAQSKLSKTTALSHDRATPIPQLILDEKRRPLESTSLTRDTPRLQIQIPPTHARDADEDTILSASTDVFSVMAEFPGSPRSPRTDFHEYPPSRPLSLLPDPAWSPYGSVWEPAPYAALGSGWASSSGLHPTHSVSSDRGRPSHADSGPDMPSTRFSFGQRRESPPASHSGQLMTPTSQSPPYRAPRFREPLQAGTP